MRTLRVMNLAFALSFLTVSSALAAGMIQKSEPNSVFKKGGNLEWSTISTGSKEFDTLHRAYQKNAEAERVLWLKENAANVGTPEYIEAKRAFLQRRNLQHRQWILEQTAGWKSGSMMKPMQMMPTLNPVDLTSDSPMQYRTFIGNAPNRRAIVQAAEKWNTLHAIILRK